MRILFVGDVVGRPGRNAVAALLPALREELRIDLAIVNGENSAGGAGLTAEIARELRTAGADVVTNGNHVWDQRQFMKDIDTLEFCIRPMNLAPGNPGRGWIVTKDVLVMNAIGRTFMAPADDPFRAVDAVLAEVGEGVPRVRILDWHAEATSEKIAMARWLDGRVTAVIGTHTHVQTNDARMLPKGTAAVTDAGMTGPHDSVIGVKAELAIARMRTRMPVRFEPAEGGVRIEGVVVDCSDDGRASGIELLRLDV